MHQRDETRREVSKGCGRPARGSVGSVAPRTGVDKAPFLSMPVPQRRAWWKAPPNAAPLSPRVMSVDAVDDRFTRDAQRVAPRLPPSRPAQGHRVPPPLPHAVRVAWARSTAATAERHSATMARTGPQSIAAAMTPPTYRQPPSLSSTPLRPSYEAVGSACAPESLRPAPEFCPSAALHGQHMRPAATSREEIVRRARERAEMLAAMRAEEAQEQQQQQQQMEPPQRMRLRSQPPLPARHACDAATVRLAPAPA